MMDLIQTINPIVWGPLMLLLILGTGLYLSIGLRGMTITQLPSALKSLLSKSSDKSSEGEISPFRALMTSLSATIGTGNIAGVGTAIAIGGPGALVWMWITAVVGMATKYAEAVLAVNYREVNHSGEHIGGPMYYIKNGLGKKWNWLAFAFAFFGSIAAFGIGNSVQANSIADGLEHTFNVPPYITGVVMMLVVGAVVLGGVKRIAAFAGRLVPVMGIAYLLCGLYVLAIEFHQIPAAFSLIINSALNGHAAAGGFAGATVMQAIQMGVARGVFSNEAGLGSAPIAHAHAQTKDPAAQGRIAMLGTFFDTLIICTITGLVIIVSGQWQGGLTGAPLTSAAFQTAIPMGGEYVVTVGLVIFAFTTIIGWSLYGERCITYLFGERAALPFKALWIIIVPIGATASLKDVWTIADTFNALMAIPNLIALLLLSPVVFKLTKKSLQAKKDAANESTLPKQ
ncbi:Amino-acid carrier protein AlsT [BD1-7 clade bacterium]|uniref:Amino-acid carrier protein AlsT n=1 Tax=BD1-7 clade bacterium TaxID=2029982 RepID=A0A5S9QPS2_9GAMM|nr:Amino-acid carrier protein AlsT [BD1-7 clade bacterium]CAA0121439.1 Amino-acid carrier protein AlsT [BD1-7 clade bacterium]